MQYLRSREIAILDPLEDIIAESAEAERFYQSLLSQRRSLPPDVEFEKAWSLVWEANQLIQAGQTEQASEILNQALEMARTID